MNYQDYVSYNPVLARRCFAALIDYALFFVLVYAYIYLFGRAKDGGYYISFLSYHSLIIIFIWLTLFPALESMLGYTLGKGLFDLKVVLDNKGDDPLLASVIRHLLDPIDLFLSLGIVAISLAMFTPKHKRLGDMVAHTCVMLDK